MASKEQPVVSQSKNRLVAWFQNYWYYYKTPVLIIGIFAVLAVIFIVDMVTKEVADMRFILLNNTPVLEEEFMTVADRAGEYVYDIDGDGKTLISPQTMQLVEDPQDDYDMMVYQQVMATMVDDDVQFYIVDDYTYNYLLNSETLALLSDFGITGGDNEYRILLNDTSLLKDTAFAERGEFYMVFKVWSEDKRDNEDMTVRYEMAVSMAKKLLGQE